MAKADILTSINANIERAQSDDFATFLRAGNKIQPWQNHTPEESLAFVQRTFETLQQINTADLFDSLPFNTLNTLNTTLNNFWAQYDSAKAVNEAQQTTHHHNPLNQLNSIDAQIRNSGLFAIVTMSPDIAKNAELIERQLENLNTAVSEANQLKTQVRTLINPSTSQALSTAFANRCWWITVNKWIWFVFLAIGIAASLCVTIYLQDIVKSILGDDADSISGGAAGWILRAALILPLYAFTGFAFAQYRKERQFEESYAHKSAIAETLPSYNEIISDPKLADTITQAMTEVVFRSPEESLKRTAKPSAATPTNELVDLLKSVSGLLKSGE